MIARKTRVLGLLVLEILLAATAFAADPQALYTLTEVDVKPQRLNGDEPRMPSHLRQETGVVKVEFVISATGKPVECTVSSSSNAKLDGWALEVVGQWRFRPAEVAGEPVAVRTVVPVRFKGA